MFGVSCVLFLFFKQKTAYEMRISDWSSDVCSSDLHLQRALRNLRLIRGIGGKELATLNQMIDAGGHMVPIRARSQEERHIAGRHVPACQGRHLPLNRHLAGVIRQSGEDRKSTRLNSSH